MTKQPMVFVGSAERHRKPEYSLRELAASGLITFQMRSMVQRELHELLRAESLENCRVDTVSSVAVMLQLVEDGAGIATLPRLLVERVNNPRLRILRCGTELKPIPLWLSWRAQGESRPTSDAMATLLLVLDELASARAQEAPDATRSAGTVVSSSVARRRG